MFRQKELLKLLEDHGEPLKLDIDNETGTYNPATGKLESPSIDTDIDFIGYFFDALIGLETSSTTVTSTRRCLIAYSGISVEPKDTHKILRGSESIDIMKVTPIMSGSTPVCYICWLVS